MRLGDVVDTARRQGFVGRRGELDAFGRALTDPAAPRVLLVHGPGGIGKTTLLQEMYAAARSAGRRALLVDGREVDPSPTGFGLAVADPYDVLLVDGFEHLAPLDGWLRREWLPGLPADSVAVFAGRATPAPAWRTDPGWRRAAALLPLGHLDRPDSTDLLRRAGVAEAAAPRLLRLGRGHPLALALLADTVRDGEPPDRLADVPDLLATLLDALWDDTPSDAHTAALAACATAWLTTEDLLRAVVGDRAPEVWSWLRGRPFVVAHARGLAPHELARDVLDAEFERRFPDRYRAVHRVVHDHVVAGIRRASGPDRVALAQHLLYLHRRSPLTAAFFQLRDQGSAAVLPAGPADVPACVDMIARGEGTESAAVAAAWFADAPDGISVVRDASGVAGFAYHLFCPSGSDLERRDPVVRAILDHVAANGPARDGELIDISRFLAGAGQGQRDPYAVLTGSVSSIVDWCTRPLAWSFIALTDHAFWRPFFDYLGFRPLLSVRAHQVDHLVFGNDWRRFPVDAWLELMNQREHDGGSGPPPDSLQRPAPLVRTAFDAAVRAALRDLHRPDALARSPLVGTRLGDSPADVRAALLAAVAAVADLPKGARRHAVLHHTFVRAAPGQEAAAEAVGLPFSTYRRYLAAGVAHVADALWTRETGG